MSDPLHFEMRSRVVLYTSLQNHSLGAVSKRRVGFDAFSTFEFGTVQFWSDFYAKKNSSFEWFINSEEFCNLVVNSYPAPKYRKVLHVGCGTSELGKKLQDVGYDVVNIDNCRTAVAWMKERNPAGTFLNMDALKLDFKDSSFDLVVDKGTMDAILFNSISKGEKMADEVFRVLKSGGSLVQVTEDPPERRLDVFNSKHWSVQWRSAEHGEFEYFSYFLKKK